jgi:hypothetical protein
MLTEEQVTNAFKEGSFLSLFEALHKDQEYWPLIVPQVGYLPGHRGEVPEDGETIFTAPDREFGLAFIDGCKSWYGTKHWFKEMVPYLRPGAEIIFQDYGHYTCFWISSLIGLSRERWQLQAYVDRTYVWKLLDPPSPQWVDENIPDEPTDVDPDTYKEIYEGFTQGAIERGDRYCIMIHQAHLAAAYAYQGLLDDSRALLDELLSKFEYIAFRAYLKSARVSPTYTPEKRIEL